MRFCHRWCVDLTRIIISANIKVAELYGPKRLRLQFRQMVHELIKVSHFKDDDQLPINIVYHDLPVKCIFKCSSDIQLIVEIHF
jgi:hypothetical protein